MQRGKENMDNKDSLSRQNLGVDSILVPTDYSSFSCEAFPWAAMFAAKFRAKIILLHVLPPANAEWMTALPGNPWESILEREDESMIEQFNASMSADFKPSLEIETCVSIGNAGSEIIEMAKRKAASIIVMGTHGRTGLSHVFIGSVAEKVVRNAPCPVFTVKPASFDKNDSQASLDKAEVSFK
jgi:nucleotide-binding universal stress UspA family protein